jgi:hypothetical protein
LRVVQACTHQRHAGCVWESAHWQKLTAYVAEAAYRNEAALTVSLMGLLAEESLIAPRLGKLERKKAAA